MGKQSLLPSAATHLEGNPVDVKILATEFVEQFERFVGTKRTELDTSRAQYLKELQDIARN